MMKPGWTSKAGENAGVVKDVLKKILKQSSVKPNWSEHNRVLPKDTSGGELGQFSGTISKAGDKFGFIECEEVAAIAGKSQVFILADELKTFQVGRLVKFTAYLDGQGRLQGKDLKAQWIPESSTPKQSGNMMGLPQALVDLLTPGGGNHSLGSPRGNIPKDTSGGELGEFAGIVEKTGAKFGFLTSPDLECIGQSSNVFVLGDEMKNLQIGQEVMFTAYLDGQGRLQGKDLQAQGGSPAGGMQDMVMVPQALLDFISPGMIPGKGGHSSGRPKTVVPKDTSGGEFGELLGTITKGGAKFGFLEAPDLESMGQPTNVFILGDELKQYKVGEQVLFTAYLDGKGRLQGKDLKPAA